MTRVTHNMLGQRSLAGLQGSLTRLAQIQEHLSTGRVINRPSDDPAGATSAMQVRSSLTQERQHVRNADDGLGWLAQIDNALDAIGDQVGRARDLALQGANSGSMGDASRNALAAEVEQLRQGVIAGANATYLDRPVFGGLTAGPVAYDADGTYVGTPDADGGVKRTVADGVVVRVDVTGPAVLDDADGDSVMTHMDNLVTGLRTGDQTMIETAIGKLTDASNRIDTMRADVGTRVQRIEWAKAQADDKEISLTNSLSEIENADLAKTVVELQLQEVAYQAALSATGRVIQPSLLEFLR
ncbi:flagellin [Nocardioides ferulae]|uniref:flagellin N-terminal helical domain-containing protein n=1 Tax=Nocardioides ferulae TaxID=2340821 RepID=UPI000EB511D9|nr:flagellin [Nocardioides ferulae]